MEKDLISVIVPIHNGAPWIDKCFTSILNQTNLDHVKVEICVCNDASTDETSNILTRWSQTFVNNNIKLQVYINESGQPKGVGFAKNRAVEISSGTYLCFQDIDDEMLPNRLSTQYNAAVKLSNNTLIGSKFRRAPQNSTKRFTKWANSLNQSQLTLQIYTSNGPTVIMPTWFCHKSVFERNIGFSEEGKGIPEDLIFFYKHLSNKGLVVRIDKRLLIYTYHPNATTFSINEETIWLIRLRRLENEILKNWPKFTIWNAGKQGRKLYKSLSEENQNKVEAFCDVDVKKISKKYIPFNKSTRTIGRALDIFHFKDANPPFVICVKIDLTGGEFEKNLSMLHLKENVDYIIFS